jgi:uncharacterized membrane protein
MSIKKSFITAAAAGIVTLAGAAAIAEDNDDYVHMEKCYGVTKAGANDCASASHDCSGKATANNAVDDFISVPMGICNKLVGGSTIGKK